MSSCLLEIFNDLAVNKPGVIVLKAFMKRASKNKTIKYKVLGACQQGFNQIAYTEFGHYIV